MKKKILIMTAALALVIAAAGCGQKNDTKNETNQTAENQVVDISDNYAEGASDNVDMDKVDGMDLTSDSDKSEASATLEESAVSIEDAKAVELDGRKYAIVSYKFTNKSDSEESFMSLMKSEAYQDGLSVNNAVGDFDIEGFDSNSIAERIKPGTTITVQQIYALVNDAPLEVVVQEFHSESGVYVTKTFNLQ